MSLFQALALAGANNGLRWASGTLTPDDEDVDVATDLPTVLFCGVSLAAPPTINHLFSQAAPSATAGKVNIKSYRPTSNSNATPIVSTTEVAVTWWAVGK